MNIPAEVSSITDERLIREGEAAVEGYNKDLHTARSRIMPMARGLCAARRKYPADQDFGDWFKGSAYRELGHQDRAALIKIGGREEFAAKFVRTTNLISPQTIWEAIQELGSVYYDSKPPAKGTSLPQTPSPTAPAPKPDEPPNNNPRAELVTAIAKDPDANKRKAAAALGVSLGAYQRTRRDVISGGGSKQLSQRMAFSGAPRAEEIAKIFQNKKTRTTLGQMFKQRGGKQAWDMLLEALDAGLLVVNNNTLNQPTMALLFPASPPRGYTAQFNLLDPRNREQVRDVILPAMIACRDRLLADPDRIRDIVNEHVSAQRTKQREIVLTEKRAVAVKSLPMAEQELVMFGQPVWPRLDNSQGEYNYDQVRAAIWTFRDYEDWNVLAKEDKQSFAMRIRNSQRYLCEYIQRTDRNNHMSKIYSLIAWFSFLMQKNPDGECKWPMYPHIEGQW